eukprot:5952016-Amphidinium_carterae.1
MGEESSWTWLVSDSILVVGPMLKSSDLAGVETNVATLPALQCPKSLAHLAWLDPGGTRKAALTAVKVLQPISQV